MCKMIKALLNSLLQICGSRSTESLDTVGSEVSAPPAERRGEAMESAESGGTYTGSGAMAGGGNEWVCGAFIESDTAASRHLSGPESPSLIRLEFLLRCLGLLGSMRAFRAVCPFNKGVRGEVVNALRKGSIMWGQNVLRESQCLPNPLSNFVTTLTADIQLGQTYYHALFDK